MIRHHMTSNIVTMTMILDGAQKLNLCMQLLETLVVELMENYDLINQ